MQKNICNIALIVFEIMHGFLALNESLGIIDIIGSPKTSKYLYIVTILKQYVGAGLST